MRVKRLEIQGFKSFKDKTVIHFDHSITGIVGPNGSGKSNIVDAFFWVMGEQSYKHMRGNSSEDLIFNGSSKYSPLGMAEATLVLETQIPDTANAPAGATAEDVPVHLKSKEISVTRRLYRSGEGEYFINGTLARLKDIHELFMDTGVGAKGYSVIEQGQIGKIVNSKPEDRRLLIEEAAGIAKYKARKKESLRKMEATQANLSRLTDIIQEIEKNLASLERQAQKARQYKKYKDELFDKEMTWGRRKSKVFRQKLESLKAKKESLEQDLIGLKASLQTAENSVEVDRIQLVTETKEAEELQGQIQDLAQDLSQEKSALDLSRRRQGDLHSQLQSLENEKQEIAASLEADQIRLQEISTQTIEAEELFQSSASESKQLGDVLSQLRKDAEQARAKLDSTQRELMSGMNQISDLTSKAASLLSRAESARAQADRLSQQFEEQQDKLTQTQEELETSKLSLDAIRHKKEELQDEKQIQSAQLQKDEQELRQVDQEKNQALKTLTQLKSKLQSLEELDQSHEGLKDGPKAALDSAKASGKSHLITALTDTVKVAKGYESVLESWLENQIDSLMTLDPGLAVSLLDQVRDENQGRVAIQILGENKKVSSKSPLSSIQKLLEESSFKVLGELSQFVSSPHHAEVLEPLLAQVCVVESSSPITEFLKKNKIEILEGWAIASLDGMVLETQDKMILRGGSLNASGVAGVLRRKQAIEELKTQVEEADEVYVQLEDKSLQTKQRVDLSKARLQTLQSDLQALEIQVAALDRDVHQTDRAVQEVKRQLSLLERDRNSAEQESERSLQERENVETRLQDLVTARTELEESQSEFEANLLEKEKVVRDQDASLQAIRVKEASLRERAVSLKREQDATRSIIHDRERRIAEIHRTLDRATREHSQFSGGESELAQRIEDLTLELSQAREKLAAVKDRIEQFNAQVNTALEQIKKLHKEGDHKTTESTELALEIEKCSGELSHLTLNLEEKYGPGCLDQTPAQPTLDDQEDLSTQPREMTHEEEVILGEEVERLRERIRRLGEVNVMAIEEFETLKKRYDHLLLEKADLERSLDNLQDAIEHINKTSEERFSKAFDAIASRFERLFPIIFGGGQAKLSLVYPENSKDILEAGVDILAQPPGKKVANITLLSGGEKALTAVSLIFAIFMVKPSPFCVLDEVDAPLDDANIGKFNALLREMSVKSQFILITHNKKTMELNDTLYGVTMEEPGVSKMVSIELH